MKIIGFLLLSILETIFAQFPGVKRVPLVADSFCDSGCIYLATTYSIGYVIDSDCLQLICTSQGWEETVNPNCCKYKGELYEEGSVLEFGCFFFNCNSGQWNYAGINGECPQCFVSTDPNIFTFDSHHYPYNGMCNYSLSQQFDCEVGCDSYFPPYAVYCQFKACDVGSVASCVGITTYKVDPHTAVVIDHSVLSIITINGNSITVPSSVTIPTDSNGYPYPVFTWFDGMCVYVIGRTYSLVACPRSLIIYTIPDTIREISGLCGFYSGVPDDDFRKRDCTSLSIFTPSDIQPFAESWMTLQYDCKCVSPPLPVPLQRRRRDVSPLCEQFRQGCQEAVNAGFQECGYPDNNVQTFALESCISDCCTEPEKINEWQEEAKIFACKVGELSQMEISGNGEFSG